MKARPTMGVCSRKIMPKVDLGYGLSVLAHIQEWAKLGRVCPGASQP